MESTENKDSNKNSEMYPKYGSTRTGRILGGLIVVGAGSVLLARQLGVAMPDWIFTWQMLLIVIGVYMLFKHSFRRVGGALTIIVIGSAFLIDHINPAISIGHLVWPALIIILGIAIMFKPKHQNRCKNQERHRRKFENRFGAVKQQTQAYYEKKTTSSSSEENGDFLDITTIFGGNHRNVFSKNFKGGDVVTVFGGTEINLMNAEIEGTATLEMTSVFGGAKLIVPSHWQVRSELNSLFGGIEDKRSTNLGIQEDPQRILVLQGTTIFGGIDIKSF